ncbi:hypothetical protein BpHYR1_028978 [Brachionus plicatilis]|uniref:Uncharacterized protein n=1 Tax=Brachionus plicatilis TaxID=10195 RepID=A0A3M7RV17_BRAPC|nr:hypothetical protein BpHYR1_028978 [Brachionus plicatilis]
MHHSLRLFVVVSRALARYRNQINQINITKRIKSHRQKRNCAYAGQFNFPIPITLAETITVLIVL